MTQSHIYLVIPEAWIENKENKITKIFYSPNQNEDADFSLPVKYFVDKRGRACYNAYSVRSMRKRNKNDFSYFMNYSKFICFIFRKGMMRWNSF